MEILSKLWAKIPSNFQWFYETWLGNAVAGFMVYQVLRRILFQKSLTGKVVVVTGAAAGIGREISLLLAKLNAKLILWDVNQDGLEAVAQEVRGLQQASGAVEPSVMTQRVDISDKQAIYSAARHAQEKLGFIYCVINNAGIVSGSQGLLHTPDDRIIKTLEVNTLAHIWIIKSFLPEMIQRNTGHVVAISSAAGLFGAAGMVDYCTSKFAVVGLMEALRNELFHMSKWGVDTTLVCPAHVRTELFKGYDPGHSLLTMSPEYVAQEVISAIQMRTQMLLLPGYTWIFYILKTLLPCGIDDRIKEALGVNSAMDRWVGRG